MDLLTGILNDNHIGWYLIYIYNYSDNFNDPVYDVRQQYVTRKKDAGKYVKAKLRSR